MNILFRPFNWFGFPTQDHGPQNTVDPVASGTPTVGQNLTVTDGIWTGTPTITYQWKRNVAGLQTDIAGETADTYTLTGDDEGALISCRVTATNASGVQSVMSNALGPIAP